MSPMSKKWKSLHIEAEQLRAWTEGESLFLLPTTFPSPDGGSAKCRVRIVISRTGQASPPTCVSNGCNGSCTLKTTNNPDGSVVYTCECK